MKILFLFWLFAPMLVLGQQRYALPQWEAHFELSAVRQNPTNQTPTLRAVLMICDNYASPELNTIAQSTRVDLGTMSQFLSLLEKRNIVKVEKTILQGQNATADKLKQTISALNPHPDDIIMFFFSGHGGMDEQKNTFLVTADEKLLTRKELETTINNKNVRFRIILTDACSNEVEGLSASRSFNKRGLGVDEGTYDEVYKTLFLGYKGTMHISSSSEGEFAWSNDNFGGFFTYYFIKEGLIKKPEADWKKIFDNAKQKTSQMFLRMPADERSELEAKGVKNQTAKLFTIPQPLNPAGRNIDNLNNNNITDDIKNNTDTQKIADNLKTQQKITIENFTNKTVNFWVDNNTPDTDWAETKITKMKIPANGTVEIPQGMVVVGFRGEDEDLHYELDQGEYYFATDEDDVLDLFYKEKGINAQNHRSFSHTDFRQILVGSWEWEDTAEGEKVQTTFKDGNVFTDLYQTADTEDQGTWAIIDKQKYAEHNYNNILALTVKDENDNEVVIDYAILMDEEDRNTVQLVLIDVLLNGNKLSQKEALEYSEPTIMMYRTRKNR